CRTLLLSRGMFWMEQYHLDGFRVDAVASMLYLDYSRKAGEWLPNIYGGRENLDAIDFLRRFNTDAYSHQQGVQTIAEESTAWPMVSRQSDVCGLCFGLWWDLRLMDVLISYMNHKSV